MKRDMDLVRKILFKLEEHESGDAPHPLRIDGYTEEQVGLHVLIMAEAGLLRAEDVTSFGDDSPIALPTRLTWKGYEFLEAARSDTLWKKMKSKLTEAGVGWTFEIVRGLLISLGKQEIGLP